MNQEDLVKEAEKIISDSISAPETKVDPRENNRLGSIAEKLLSLNPNSSKGHFFMGVYERNNKNYEKSIRHFRLAINKEPANSEYWNELGYSQYHIVDTENAYKSFKKSLDLNPQNKNALYNMGVLHDFLEQYNSALEYYNKCLKVDSGYIDALHNKGRIKQEQNEFEKAIEYYDKVISLSNPTDWKALHNKAICLLNKDDYEGALKLVSKSLKLNPKEPGVMLTKSHCLINLNKNLDEAKKLLEEVLEIDPSKIRALGNLGIIYFDENNYEKALPFFQRMLKYDTKDIQAIAYVISCFYHLKRETEAIKLLTSKKHFSSGERDELQKNLREIISKNKIFELKEFLRKFLEKQSEKEVIDDKEAFLMKRDALKKIFCILVRGGSKDWTPNHINSELEEKKDRSTLNRQLNDLIEKNILKRYKPHNKKVFKYSLNDDVKKELEGLCPKNKY